MSPIGKFVIIFLCISNFRGDANAVRSLLETVDVNDECYNGATPLVLAVQKNRDDMVQLILSYNPSVRITRKTCAFFFFLIFFKSSVDTPLPAPFSHLGVMILRVNSGQDAFFALVCQVFISLIIPCLLVASVLI